MMSKKIFQQFQQSDEYFNRNESNGNINICQILPVDHEEVK